MRVLGPQDQLPQVKAQAVANQVRSLIVGFFRGLLRFLDVSAFCQRCQTKLELTREEVVHWSEDHQVHGIRFWRCPNCGDRTQEGYKYFVDLDAH